MEYSIKDATIEDISIVIKYNATYGELEDAFDFVEMLENKIYTSRDELWNKICSILYAYKLGQMQGKREERARRRKSL